MKKVEAIIRPKKLEDVTDRLRAIGVKGMTMVEVRGRGRNGGQQIVHRGVTYVGFVPMVHLQVVVPDDFAGAVARALADFARTGQDGDGLVFIGHVDEAIRIRTGEHGDDAV